MSGFSTIVKGALGAAGAMAATAAIKHTADRFVGTALDKAILTAQSAAQANGNRSYVRAASSVRVEPFITMDERFVEMEDVRKDVVGLAQRLFTCYYLLAHAAHDVIAGTTISERVSRFNPDRDLQDATYGFLSSSRRRSEIRNYSSESYHFGLPEPSRVQGLDRYGALLSDEQFYTTESKINLVANSINESAAETTQSTVSTKESIEKTVKETANLALGQTVELTVRTDGMSQTVPVQIRLRPLTVPSEVMVGTLSLRGKSYSLPDRLRARRAGSIDWKDLIFQTDRVKEYKRLAKQDKSKFFQKTHNRANKHLLGALISGKGSVGEMSSILVLSRDTVVEFERSSGLRLDDFRTRQRILEDTLTMVILVVDQSFQTVKVYLDSIDDSDAEYNIADLKAGGKNDGNDLMKTLTSLMEGRIPGRL